MPPTPTELMARVLVSAPHLPHQLLEIPPGANRAGTEFQHYEFAGTNDPLGIRRPRPWPPSPLEDGPSRASMAGCGCAP